jgi:hypothetical protein
MRLQEEGDIFELHITMRKLAKNNITEFRKDCFTFRLMKNAVTDHVLVTNIS